MDIYSHGFEKFRESVEVKYCGSGGSALEFASLVPVKGLGKVSILFFGLLWTYVKLRDSLSKEELEDFQRRPPISKGRLWYSWESNMSKVMVWLKPSPLGICWEVPEAKNLDGVLKANLLSASVRP